MGDRIEKLFLSPLAPAINELHRALFFPIIIPATTTHRGLAQGRGKVLKTHPLLYSRAHLADPCLPPGQVSGAVCVPRASTQGQAGRSRHRDRGQRGTHGGEGADLFDVLLVALGAGGAPGGPSGVPEGVVVLQGVLSGPRDHSLHNRETSLPLLCSSKKGNGENYIYSIKRKLVKPSEASLLIIFFSSVLVSREKKDKLKREMRDL